MSTRRFLALATSLSLAASVQAADSLPPNPALHSGAERTASGETRIGHSWEAPPIEVRGTDWGLREQEYIGSYGQPRWSARRRFTETRAYVRPEGQIEFEYWLTFKDRKRGDENGESKVVQQYEIEIGLPNRFQLDLYQAYEKEGREGANALAETKAEVRWALADWSKIWANPTLYAEWAIVNGGPDVAEFKVLLADDLAPGWVWAANLVYETEVGGDKTHTYEITGGVARAMLDEVFSLGLEAKFAWEDTAADRGNYENEILVGPSIQYRPLPQMHIDLAIMAGLTDDSPRSKTVAIVGWEF